MLLALIEDRIMKRYNAVMSGLFTLPAHARFLASTVPVRATCLSHNNNHYKIPSTCWSNIANRTSYIKTYLLHTVPRDDGRWPAWQRRRQRFTKSRRVQGTYIARGGEEAPESTLSSHRITPFAFFVFVIW